MRFNKWIMVGYSDDHSPDTYRMYDPNTKMIKSTRDIRWTDWKRNDPASSLSLFETAKKQEQQKKKKVEDKKKIAEPTPPEPIRPNVVEDDNIEDSEPAPRFGQAFQMFRPITPDGIGGGEQDLADNNDHNDDEAGRILDDE
jgi:hypothetical protein